MKTKHEIKWLSEPAEKDYPAAASYLSLLFPEEIVRKMINALQEAPMSEFHAKDIIRASNLKELEATNFHIRKTTAKIINGDSISPILIIRARKPIVADGSHRLRSVYLYDEDAMIPCKITS